MSDCDYLDKELGECAKELAAANQLVERLAVANATLRRKMSLLRKYCRPEDVRAAMSDEYWEERRN